MSVAANLARVRARILQACRAAGRDPAEVRLLPVSKTQPQERVQELLACGVVELAENRARELTERALAFAKEPVRWHLIGSLQTNKVRDLLAVPSLALVQSLDREKLADTLQAELARQGRVLDALVQLHATDEETKHGVRPEAAEALVRHVRAACPNLVLRGVMAMGPLHGDPAPVFARVADLHRGLCERFGIAFPILSMGMSGDFEVAIAHGATLVRVGSALFAE